MKEIKEKEFMEKMSEDFKKEDTKEDLNVDFNIDTLVKIGVIEKEFELVKGLKIKMHTLDDGERIKAMKLISPEENELEYLEKIRRPTLAYAITQINEDEFKNDNIKDKEKLYLSLKKTQSNIIDLLYFKYFELLTEQGKFFEEDDVKKK